MRNFLKVTQIAFLLLILSGCGREYFFSSLEEPVSAGKVTPSSCRDTLLTTKENIKIIFMLDHSGSTENGEQCYLFGFPIASDLCWLPGAIHMEWTGTDNERTFRTGTIRKFLATYGSKRNLTYSIALFGSFAEAYDTAKGEFSLQNTQTAFGTAMDMGNALNQFAILNTLGFTSYRSAFESLKNIISNDVTAENHPRYIVVFMSDGKPTDPKAESCSQESQVDEKIAGLVNDFQQTVAAQHQGAVTVSSVYFGGRSEGTSCDGKGYGNSENGWAIHHLKEMARVGGGQFVDTNLLTSELNVEDIIQIPGQICSQ